MESITDMCEIVNTAQFRFPPGSPRPTLEDIATFLKELNADVNTMETVYKTAHDRSLFIKFTSQAALLETMERNAEPKTFAYSNGSCVEVRMFIAGTNVRYVRVFDLPPEVTDNTLTLEMEKFGTVQRVVREKFPANLGLGHLFTGVRGVHIDVKKDISPMIEVMGRKGRIFYDGLKNTCFSCHATGHRKDSCPKRRSRDKKETPSANTTPSYAGVVAGNYVAEEQVFSTVTEDNIIEILEDDGIEEATDTIEAEEEQPEICEPGADLEEQTDAEKKDDLEDAAKANLETMGNPQANQRRAQFAASHSGSGSGSSSRPRKKCARIQYY
ncbi:hypothetical protein RP20_CCG013357 [Aedes albopictus]|nr:hypothetical protein RP20_CCG004766 [Aedes albopictus]KXJ74592.1 hypothetical protein RP20_CCG013357 [Aedes albopictus]